MDIISGSNSLSHFFLSYLINFLFLYFLTFSLTFFCFLTVTTRKRQEDDIKAILKRIRCCFKTNSLARKLLNHLLSEMGLFTRHNCSVSCSLNYLFITEFKVDFLFQSFLDITVLEKLIEITWLEKYTTALCLRLE